MTSLSSSRMTDIKIIALVCIPHMLSHVYWLVIPPMFPILMSVYDLNYTQVGAIMTAFAAATSIAQTPIGFLVDKIGARTVLIFGLAIEGLAIAGFGFSTSYWQLVLLAVVAGLGHTVFHPADYAILSSKISEKRMGRAFSVHSATGYLGFAIAPVFMTGVSQLWHWRASFILIGLVGILAALVLVSQMKILGDKKNASADRSSGTETASNTDEMGFTSGIRLLVSLPVLMCFLYFVLHQMGGGGVRTFLVAVLNELYGTPEILAAFALSAFTIGSVVGILSGGYVADRFGPRVTTAVFTLVPASVIIALLGWIDVRGFLLVFLLAIAGYLIGLLIPSRDLLLRSVTPAGSMGKVMGFASTGSNIGGALIPVILGYAMDNIGGQWVFWISAVFIAAAFLTFVTARTKYGA